MAGLRPGHPRLPLPQKRGVERRDKPGDGATHRINMSDDHSSRVGARRTADPTLALVVVLALVLGAMTIPPLVSLVQASLRVTTATGDLGDFTFRHYRMILTDRGFFQSLANSLVFAIGTAALAIGLGGFSAWLVVRTDTPLKSLAYMSAIVSLG